MAKDRLISEMNRVGRMIARAEKTGRSISPSKITSAKKTLDRVRAKLIAGKEANKKIVASANEKRHAVAESVREGLLTRSASKSDMGRAIRKSVKASKSVRNFNAALSALNRIALRLKKAENLDAYDKGHASSEKIKGPKLRADDKEKAVKSSGKKLAHYKKIYAKALALTARAKKEKNSSKKKSLLLRASILERMADTIKSEAKSCPKTDKKEMDKKESFLRRKSRLKARSYAKKIRSKDYGKKQVDDSGKQGTESDKYRKDTKKSGLAKIKRRRSALKLKRSKKFTDKKADNTVFSSSDKVLLADGTVGTVSSVNNDKLIVSVGGKEKEVLANTVKKISANKKEGLRDRIQTAIKSMAKKKTAEDADIAGVEVEVDGVQPKAKPAGDEEKLVSNSEIKSIDFIEGQGWIVNKSNNEVISFGEDKAAAEEYVRKTSAKKRADAKKASAKIAETIRRKKSAKDSILDSAQHNKAEGSEGISKKMKGLTQKGRGYKKTDKDEMINPQNSTASKKLSTKHSKGTPVDSATTKKPSGTESIVGKIRGLTQKNKGYGQTKSDQKINPNMGVYAKKAKALEKQSKEQANRLKELESSALVDRAVKAGAITEADRSEQQQVLAELYVTSKSEFDAYARLVGQMEKNSGKDVQANRVHKKIANSMASKRPQIVEGSDITQASLDTGNFFED